MKDPKEVLYPTNEFQTPLTQELKESMPEEVWSKLMEFIGTVKFVTELVSPDRRRYNEMEREANGRIIVDPSRPHVLENMDFFVTTRSNFEQHGYYTAAKPSNNPTSDYRKFWDEEIRRCTEYYVDPTTGEWVPGYLYFYWNYGRLKLTVKREGSKKSKSGKTRADRVDAFPDKWEADYFFFHYLDQAEEAGEYASMLKCRGVGFSFKASNMTLRNFFLIVQSKSYVTASLDGYLFEDGIMNKVLEGEGFIQQHTAFKKRKLYSGIEHLMAGFKDKSANNAQAGYLSEITAVNVRNPQAIRGKRGKLIIHEEAGSNKGLITAWHIADKSLDDRDNVFGLQLAAGTGGDKNSDFEGLGQLFFKPDAHNVYGIPNVFDKNASANLSGYFIGEYMNRPDSYNSDGITDVVANLITIFRYRWKLETKLDDPEQLAKRKAEGAITPTEAIVTMHQSVFPKELVKNREMELSTNYIEITRTHHNVRLSRTGAKVTLLHSSRNKPIIDYPYVGSQAASASVTIKNLPETHGNEDIPWLRYGIGVDTLDDDGGVGSLFSVTVMDFWKDEIVAWYIGRNLMVEDDYDIVLNLAMLYNATVNYESNLKGLYSYFKNHNALRYLCDTPQILVDRSLIGNTQRIGNKTKGTRASKSVNAWGRRLQADWLRAPHAYREGLRGVDTVEDIEWLREMGMYNPDGNFDKISANNMLFILRENLIQVTDGNKFLETRKKSDYEDDEFLQEFDLSLGSDLDF
tara:strand:+ start:29437 stop:31668 length:2232 start_codon:yes stop_codon:yes gene_type:complete